MGDNTGHDDLFMNLDLNREPFVDPSPPSPPAPSSPWSQSFSDEQGPPRLGIEDRIRLLRAITASTRQPQRNPRIINNPVFNFMSSIDPIGLTNEIQACNGVAGCGSSTETGNSERSTNRKRDFSHLAKALQMDLHAEKTDDDEDINGHFFDCNLCLKMAKDPILTCCGHLFCWGCFYQVPHVDSISKECPVCNGEVTDSNITPIYGNGNATNSQSLESISTMRIRFPPRPRAQRVESVSQQSFGISLSPSDPAAEDSRVDVQSQAQRFLDTSSYMHFGTLATEGSRSRRRNILRALNSEAESSLQLRR